MKSPLIEMRQLQRVVDAELANVKAVNAGCIVAYRAILGRIKAKKIALRTLNFVPPHTYDVSSYADQGELRLHLHCWVGRKTQRLQLELALGYIPSHRREIGDNADHVWLKDELIVKFTGDSSANAWSIQGRNTLPAIRLSERLGAGLKTTGDTSGVLPPAHILTQTNDEPENDYFMQVVDQMIACFLDPQPKTSA